ncbi:MAG: 2-oxoacid:acceptor oxidoreductase family protein, partial [Angelakisella sp.]
IVVDALSPAVALGNSKAVNMVLMGVLSRVLDIPAQQWQDAITQSMKPALLELNLNAFEAGRTLYEIDAKGGAENGR